MKTLTTAVLLLLSLNAYSADTEQPEVRTHPAAVIGYLFDDLYHEIDKLIALCDAPKSKEVQAECDKILPQLEEMLKK